MTLADKIVLLHTGERIATHGSVAQVGSPMALYHRPCSLFVAEFIGSPKMNVVPATLQHASASSAEVVCGGKAFQVAVDASQAKAGDALHLGLRPEDCTLSDDHQAPNTLPGRITHIERLGESSMLYLEIGQGLPVITVKLEGTTSLKNGTEVGVRVLAEKLHLFNAAGDAFRRTVELPS